MQKWFKRWLEQLEQKSTDEVPNYLGGPKKSLILCEVERSKPECHRK
jgi:hypothetical protein